MSVQSVFDNAVLNVLMEKVVLLYCCYNLFVFLWNRSVIQH